MLLARRSALVGHLYESDYVSFAVFFVDFQTNANKVSAGRHELAALVEAIPVQAVFSAGARAFASQRPQPSAAQVKELYAQLTALLNLSLIHI